MKCTQLHCKVVIDEVIVRKINNVNDLKRRCVCVSMSVPYRCWLIASIIPLKWSIWFQSKHKCPGIAASVEYSQLFSCTKARLKTFQSIFRKWFISFVTAFHLSILAYKNNEMNDSRRWQVQQYWIPNTLLDGQLPLINGGMPSHLSSNCLFVVPTSSSSRHKIRQNIAAWLWTLQ